MVILIWFFCWKTLCGSQCRKCRRITEIQILVPPTSCRWPRAHSSEGGFSEAAPERFTELECYAAAQFSQVTSRSRNSHWKTTHVVVTQRYSWLHRAPNTQPSAQNSLQFCPRSEPGSKEYGGGGTNVSVPSSRSRYRIWSALCDFTSFFWCQNKSDFLPMHCNTYPKLSGSGLGVSSPVLLWLCCTSHL